ncbi:MAG: LysR family transcriptional regulator [Myxococcales bacterium]|nr:LysR family transcriptional regulator [Myxococcales bacterium]
MPRWLNYHHLQYFWATARLGSVAAASAELGLAPQTISAQIHQLERVIGVRLFARKGRGLVVTEAGRTALRYAEQIFALGTGLLDRLDQDGPPPPPSLVIGIDDAVPRAMVYRMLEPALRLEPPVRIVGRDDRPAADFLAELATGAVEVVLADGPAPSPSPVRVWSHLLGECGTVLVAAPSLARRLTGRAPARLRGAPFLMPGARSAVRRALDAWVAAVDVRPKIIAELDDLALVEALGERGLGVFAVPTVIEAEVCRRQRVEVVARLPALRQRFYAISTERTIRHAAVAAICATARQDVFARRGR